MPFRDIFCSIQDRYLVNGSYASGNMIFSILVICCLGAFFGQGWPPGPLETGQARKMVQKANKISPVS